MKTRILMLLLSLSSPAMADQAATDIPAEGRALSPAQQWLELQRSGKAASAQAQPVSGEVMDRVHKRYLKSFEHPVPAFYEQQPVNR